MPNHRPVPNPKPKRANRRSPQNLPKKSNPGPLHIRLSFDPSKGLCHTARGLIMMCCAILLIPSARLACASLLLGSVFTAAATAQSAGDILNGQGSHRDQIAIARSYSTAPNTGVLIFAVFAERHGTSLDRQALLKLVNLTTQSPLTQTTENTSQGPYDQSGSLGVFTDIPYGNYDVEVSAVGYLSTHKELTVGSTQVQQHLDIVLRRDPAAINLDIADTLLSAKTRKEAKRGVSALK